MNTRPNTAAVFRGSGGAIRTPISALILQTQDKLYTRPNTSSVIRGSGASTPLPISVWVPDKYSCSSRAPSAGSSRQGINSVRSNNSYGVISRRTTIVCAQTQSGRPNSHRSGYSISDHDHSVTCKSEAYVTLPTGQHRDATSNCRPMTVTTPVRSNGKLTQHSNRVSFVRPSSGSNGFIVIHKHDMDMLQRSVSVAKSMVTTIPRYKLHYHHFCHMMEWKQH